MGSTRLAVRCSSCAWHSNSTRSCPPATRRQHLRSSYTASGCLERTITNRSTVPVAAQYLRRSCNPWQLLAPSPPVCAVVTPRPPPRFAVGQPAALQEHKAQTGRPSTTASPWRTGYVTRSQPQRGAACQVGVRVREHHPRPSRHGVGSCQGSTQRRPTDGNLLHLASPTVWHASAETKAIALRTGCAHEADRA